MRKAGAILTLALMASASSPFAQERVKNGGLDFGPSSTGGSLVTRASDSRTMMAARLQGVSVSIGPRAREGSWPLAGRHGKPNTDTSLPPRSGRWQARASVALRGADGKDVVIAAERA